MTRKKNRDVSYDSPFEPNNIPPKEHLLADIILDKPGKIDLSRIDATKIPLAGRMGELGKLILNKDKITGKMEMGKHISTGPWGEE